MRLISCPTEVCRIDESGQSDRVFQVMFVLRFPENQAETVHPVSEN